LQLLEDMQLISCNETDGKKLYRITNEGLRYLRKMEKEAAEQHKNLWEHLRRHDKHGGGHGKHLFRALMKEWPDVIHLIAKATEAAKVAPSSQQTTQFHELMSKFQKDLNELLTSTPNPNTDKTVPNDNRPED